VSSMGDAKTLQGGVLLQTPLTGADGKVYAVAQGPVLASGFSAEGEAASVTFGSPTTGSIPQGARVEREVRYDFSSMTRVRLALRAPDFTTAAGIEAAINARLAPGIARMSDPGTVEIDVAKSGLEPVRLLAEVENLRIAPEQKARIVIDQKSGTVVLGADVQMSEFAVTQGNLTIAVRERPGASQSNPFSPGGETIVLPDTEVGVDTGADARIGRVARGASLADLIEGLNALGVGPRELIDILKSVKAAGALHAEIIVM
ncbi:MAG: flagellar basal body P-ring protein FlgI, partial [Parvularculaceae bacterium]